jgi:hypothetical protein
MTRLHPDNRYVVFRQWLHSVATPLRTLFTGMVSRHLLWGSSIRKLAVDDTSTTFPS